MAEHLLTLEMDGTILPLVGVLLLVQPALAAGNRTAEKDNPGEVAQNLDLDLGSYVLLVLCPALQDLMRCRG